MSPGPVPLAPAARAIPLRDDRRREVRHGVDPGEQGAAALAAETRPADELPESVVLRRPDGDPFSLEGSDAARRPTEAPALTDDPRVRWIATLRDPVEPPVVDDFATEPAYDPVIGPELAAARTRVGLTVDELAERTRIRPHVIESIEVDDFAPCGGDFYARGHIRTLARVLGQDAGPMLRHFEQRYATAPVSPRRVFEAELATGLGGSGRRASGGPSWSLLVGLVLVLVLVWSAVRLFAGDGERMLENPPPVLNGSQGLGGYDIPAPAAPRPVEARLAAQAGGTHVRVTDADDVVVFEGDLATGEEVTVHGDPPLTVAADDGGLVDVTVAGVDRGLLGEPGQPATQTYPRP
jgi:cytoskeletal protein RodZ